MNDNDLGCGSGIDVLAEAEEALGTSDASGSPALKPDRDVEAECSLFLVNKGIQVADALAIAGYVLRPSDVAFVLGYTASSVLELLNEWGGNDVEVARIIGDFKARELDGRPSEDPVELKKACALELANQGIWPFRSVVFGERRVVCNPEVAGLSGNYLDVRCVECSNLLIGQYARYKDSPTDVLLLGKWEDGRVVVLNLKEKAILDVEMYGGHTSSRVDIVSLDFGRLPDMVDVVFDSCSGFEVFDADVLRSKTLIDKYQRTLREYRLLVATYFSNPWSYNERYGMASYPSELPSDLKVNVLCDYCDENSIRTAIAELNRLCNLCSCAIKKNQKIWENRHAPVRDHPMCDWLRRR